jgi:hypothetical protein
MHMPQLGGLEYHATKEAGHTHNVIRYASLSYHIYIYAGITRKHTTLTISVPNRVQNNDPNKMLAKLESNALPTALYTP